MKNYYLTLLFLGVVYCGYGQVGIGTTLPNTSSELDVVSENKGILIPRVSLTSTIDSITITNGNVNSLLVFNTQTIADITPGYYYWYINKWYRIGTTLAETITTLIDNGDGTITYTNESGTPVTINLPVGPQGLIGLTGPAGATGAQGIAGTNGTNGKSVTGSTYDSTTGIVTFTYSDGTTSTTSDLRGATGAAGTNGTNGTNGKSVTGSTYDSTTGIVTFTYSDGTTSTTSDLRGATGVAGTNGTNGTNGKSVTGSTYDSTTGIVTFTYSDGTTSTTSDLRGATGAAGTNGTNGKSVTGSTYDSTTGIVTFTYSDGTTSTTSDLRGATGAAGTNGTNGTNGVDGAVGSQGPIGLTGPAGANGIDGINGTNGVDGAVGPQGPIGLTGSAGANGADGVGGVTTAGTNVTITGVGTVASPYIVNASSPTQTNTTLALDTTTNILTYTNENSDNPTIDLSTLKIEPWLVQTTTDQATLNTQNIYQMGTVAIGKNEVLADVALDVQGAIRVGSNHIGLVGANSAAFGDNVSVYARNSMGIGNQNKIFSDNALIVGRNNLIGVNGNSNAIFGSNNKEYNAGGVWSNNTIFGDNNTMTGEEGGPTLRNNTVFGEKNIITSIGSGARINNNTLFGNNNWSGISSSNSTIFGEYNISDSYNQFIIGKANRNIYGSIFEIGIGTDASNRANALTVIPNGNVGIANEAVNPTEKLDIGSGNVRVRDINTNTGASTDNIVVADATGVLKTVPASKFSKIDYSYVEQETGRKWVDGTPAFEITGHFNTTADFTTINVHDLVPNFVTTDHVMLLEVRLISVGFPGTWNGTSVDIEAVSKISTHVQSFSATTGIMTFGTPGSLAVNHPAGEYYIIIEYVKTYPTANARMSGRAK
ncbi:S-layer family protein [Flavobacterium sp. 123]|uniref:beta strand repeat-containing protein n=1 Tax=Flavobacterium sp. 123 TaxID=2135627 RepID=UPI000EAB759F|nr:hypothetical protein [Flavobacterium sp. 123]RKT00459.1 collagen triple helix repeat protein [Flavobacterium sp. 123]